MTNINPLTRSRSHVPFIGAQERSAAIDELRGSSPGLGLVSEPGPMLRTEVRTSTLPTILKLPQHRCEARVPQFQDVFHVLCAGC